MLKKETCAVRLKKALAFRNMKQADLSQHTNIPKSAISQYLAGKFEPKQDRLELIATTLNVSEAWLMGYDVSISREDSNKVIPYDLPSPSLTDDYTTFPVIGEVAAGYDVPAIEDWTGETVEIPNSYLKGRAREDFFVLRVKGDSMYPTYQDGDRVLILRQSTLNHSGQIGVVVYNDDCGTLKKVEYVYGEDWMKLIPINPAYPPIKIVDEGLEHCKVLGIPRLLLREIEE